MVGLLKKYSLIKKKAELLKIHEDDKILAFAKSNKIFIFNFHPEKSFEGYFINVKRGGEYKVVLNTDEERFGGFERVSKEYVYSAQQTEKGEIGIKIYLPQRTAIVLEEE